MNHIILIVEIVVAFSMLVAAKKLFGKAGIMAWIAIATVFANIFEAKNMMLFGLNECRLPILIFSNSSSLDNFLLDNPAAFLGVGIIVCILRPVLGQGRVERDTFFCGICNMVDQITDALVYGSHLRQIIDVCILDDVPEYTHPLTEDLRTELVISFDELGNTVEDDTCGLAECVNRAKEANILFMWVIPHRDEGWLDHVKIVLLKNN